jgi:hypothetical protein
MVRFPLLLNFAYSNLVNNSSATIPYCVNITLGGADQPYTAFACGSSVYTSYPEVQLTYTGETTVNYLPRYLDANGDVSYGTQIPSGAALSSSSSSAATTSSSQSSSSLQSSLTSPTSVAQVTSETATATPTPVTSSSSNTGAIVGGAVGGVGAIAIIAGIVVYFIIRSRKKQREAGLAQNAQVAGEAETKAQFPSGQSYPGTPAPMYPQQGMYGQPGYVTPQQSYPQQVYYPQQQDPNELSGGAIPGELQAVPSPIRHQSFHELQS